MIESRKETITTEITLQDNHKTDHKTRMPHRKLEIEMIEAHQIVVLTVMMGTKIRMTDVVLTVMMVVMEIKTVTMVDVDSTAIMMIKIVTTVVVDSTAMMMIKIVTTVVVDSTAMMAIKTVMMEIKLKQSTDKTIVVAIIRIVEMELDAIIIDVHNFEGMMVLKKIKKRVLLSMVQILLKQMIKSLGMK